MSFDGELNISNGFQGEGRTNTIKTQNHIDTVTYTTIHVLISCFVCEKIVRRTN